MPKPFEKLSAGVRRRWLLEASLKAAQNVPEGAVGDIVRQLRWRARRANVWTNVILAALGVTILIGLLFFVGGPLWKQNLDSERRVLGDELTALTGQDASLDIDRKSVQGKLVEALKGSAEVVPSGTEQYLGGSLVDRADHPAVRRRRRGHPLDRRRRELRPGSLRHGSGPCG